MRRFLLLFVLVLSDLLAVSQVIPAPVLFYSDIDSGPAIGGEGGADGAFVCVYGENFGSSQGSSTITVGGTAAAQYKLWSDPGVPYQPGTNVAKACVQISQSTPSGSQAIVLSTSSGVSNSLPFTVRPGTIWWVSASGNDITGNGSQAQPWATIGQCKNQMVAGDICEIQDGVAITSMENWEAALWLNSSGAAGSPKAVVAYPGAHVSIAATIASGQWASTGQLQGINNYSGGTSTCGSGGCSYWTIAGFNQINGSNGSISLLGGSNIRLVDNDIVCQGAYCEGPNGGLSVTASRVTAYGNRFHDLGCHDDVNYTSSAHPCVWQTPTVTISTIGVNFTLSGTAAGLTEGDVIQVGGQLRRVASCSTRCVAGLTAGILDAAFTSDLPLETPFQFRDFVPNKTYQNVYFGNNANSVQFGWNNLDGSVGKACRGVQFNAVMLDSTTGFSLYDLHVHDNFIHDTVCDGINFATVDPSQGTVEAYNNVIYNAGEGNGSIFNGGDPVGGMAHYACVYGPGYVSNGPPGSGSILLYNNTLYNCGSRVILNNATSQTGAIAMATGSTPNLYVVASNNILSAANPAEVYVQNVSNRLCTGVTSYCPSASVNNVFWGSSGTAPSYLTNNLLQNPQFDNPPSDFHLYLVNPDAGASTAGLASAMDADGVTRNSASPTPGAYEYVSVAPANPRAPAASVTVITSTGSPQNFGVRVPFVILVSPSTPGPLIPTGQVAIYDGSTQLTQLSLDGNGYASFAMSSLAPGVHNITANYSGDASFAPSQGSISQTIDGPVLSVSATNIAFTSALGIVASQTITVNNTGSGPLTISAISFAGSSEFSISNNTCFTTAPGFLGSGNSCTVVLNFRPAIPTTVLRKGTFAVAVGAPAVSSLIPVTGTVVAPTMSLSQSSLSFDPQILFTTSASQTVTVTNTSSLANLKILAVTVPANFVSPAGANQCATDISLAPGGSCSIYVQFRPYLAGLKSGLLGVLVAAPGTSQKVAVSGTAVGSFTVSPVVANFGLTTRGTSKTIVVTVVNPANNPTVSGLTVALTGNTHYSQSTTNPGSCGSTLPGATIQTTCTINLVYAPTADEPKARCDSGSLTVTGIADGLQESKSISINGVAF